MRRVWMVGLLVLAACSTSIEAETEQQNPQAFASDAAQWPDQRCLGTFELIGSWSSEERVDFTAAARRWATVSKRTIVFTQNGLCRVRAQDLDEGAAAVSRAETGNIDIDRVRVDEICDAPTPDFRSACRQAIYMHEIGHSIGIPHLPVGQKGIMAEYDRETWGLTQADIAACQHAGVCPTTAEE